MSLTYTWVLGKRGAPDTITEEVQMLTATQVENWNWVYSPRHHKRVPEISPEEVEEYQRLRRKTWLETGTGEMPLLLALRHKLKVRRDRRKIVIRK